MSTLIELIGNLTSNSSLNFVIGASGVILAFYFYLKQRKVKIPLYDIKGVNVVRDIGGRFENLEMYYRKKRIDNFTISKLAFWNAGEDTINWTDVAELDPIVIAAKEGCQILDSDIIAIVNKTNGFAREERDNKIYIKFSYISRGQGAIFQVIHTGKKSSDIKFQGTLKDIAVMDFVNKSVFEFVPLLDKLLRYLKRMGFGLKWLSPDSPDSINFLFFQLYLIFVVSFISTFIGSNSTIDFDAITSIYGNSFYLVLLLFLTASLVIAKYLWYQYTRKMPKDLRKFWKE